MVEPHCSNFKIITANFPVSEFLGILWYFLLTYKTPVVSDLKDVEQTNERYVLVRAAPI